MIRARSGAAGSGITLGCDFSAADFSAADFAVCVAVEEPETPTGGVLVYAPIPRKRRRLQVADIEGVGWISVLGVGVLTAEPVKPKGDDAEALAVPGLLGLGFEVELELWRGE